MSVRDSAGIRIVESAAPAWPDSAPGWRLSHTPRLEIGGAGAADFPFQQVHDATLLSDGRIIVGDGGARALAYFAADGRHLRTAGRRGQGPGEFGGSLRFLERMRGDTVLAPAATRSHWQVFDPSGEYIRQVPVPTLAPASEAGLSPWSPGAAWLPDGSAILIRLAPVGQVAEGTTAWDSLVFIVPGAEMEPGGRMAVAAQDWVRGRNGRQQQPYPEAGAFSAHDADHLYYSSGADPEVRVFQIRRDGEGVPVGLDLVRIMRRAWSPTRLTGSMLADLRTGYGTLWGRDTSASGRWRFEQFDQLPHRSTLPVHGHMLADRAGNVWLPRFTPALAAIYWPPDVAVTWDVYGADGAWLGGVAMPARFWPFEIGQDWVLGLWRDEMDVEYVQLYGLIKEGTS